MKKGEEQQEKVAMMTPKKVRGTATIYADGDIDFRAYGEGSPTKKILKRSGNSQLYETTGEKSPKLVAHLMVGRDDPAALTQLQQRLDEVTTGYGNTEDVQEPLKSDTLLWDEKGLRVWFRKKTQDIAVSLTLPVDYEKPIQEMALKSLTKLFQCFTINRQFLVRAVHARKTTSSD